MRLPLFLILSMAALAALCVWPEIDLFVSGWFFVPPRGFVWKDFWALLALNDLAYYGARALGAALLAGAVFACVRRGSVLRLSRRDWAFLFLALGIGPGLVANLVFKDHWGRARPREIAQFGGAATFTPPLALANQCDSNCSFVSGDGAFGFFLPSFAYVASPRRRRCVFWGLMGVGGIFGAARIVMGAHFLSDVLFAAFFMLLVSALLFGALYGRKPLRACWRDWLGEGR